MTNAEITELLAKASPRPWAHGINTTECKLESDNRFSNMMFIILAVNSYEALREENLRLRDALEQLRDCDWVITPANRMDAVRDIARAALEPRK